MRLRAIAIWLSLCLALMGVLALPARADDPPFSEEYEKSVGAEAAAKVDAEYERFEDEEAQARVNEIVARIVPHTGRPDVQYDVRLIDTDEANAFSLPGGIIYVTRGLLESVESDHELAGVLAHEMGHNCTYDALYQAERNKDLFTGSVAGVIAAILLGTSSEEISMVLMAGEYIRQGVLGGYSIEMERRADAHAVEYLLHTDYNPVGLLTFMERLAAEERRTPHLEPGVYRTHPPLDERVRALRQQISAAGREINRRATTQWERPKAEEIEEDGATVVRVVLWEKEIFRVLVAGPEHDTPMARGEAIAARLSQLLADGLMEHEVQVGEHEGNPAVCARGEVIVTLYPEDAEAQATDAAQIAEEVSDHLREALAWERLDRIW